MLYFSGTFPAFYYLFYKSSSMKVGPKTKKTFFFFAIPPEDMLNDEVQSVVYIRCCTYC